MKLYPLGWFHPPSSSFQIFSAGAQELGGSGDHDEILHVSGKEVVWSAGIESATQVRKSYKQVLNAKQALLSRFVGVGDGTSSNASPGDDEASGGSFHPDGNEQAGIAEANQQPLREESKCLCVLQGVACLKIYAPDGAEFEVALPCKAAKMWELPRGLLIEREAGSVGDEDRNLLAPVMFSLLHPLEELKPVSYTDPRNGNGPKSEFMCDIRERIVFCSAELLLVVTYNEGEKAHSIWSLLPATALEMRENNRKQNTLKKQSGDDLIIDTPMVPNVDDDEILSSDDPNTSDDDDMDQTAVGEEPMHLFGDQDDAEDEDDVIESEIFMERIWTAEATSERADDVFVAHDVEGQALICMVDTSSSTLAALSVKLDKDYGSFKVSPAFRLDVKSAQPVRATGSKFARDILVLNKESKLILYRGNMRLCELDVDKPLNSTIVRLDRAVSDRVNLHFDNGQIMRASASMEVLSKLARPCLEALDVALPPEIALSLRVDIAIWHDKIMQSTGENKSNPVLDQVVSALVGEKGLAQLGTGVDMEWAAFIMVITRLAANGVLADIEDEDQQQNSCEILESFQRPDETENADDDDDEWFSRLLDTGYHLHYEKENQGMFELDPSLSMESITPEIGRTEQESWYANLKCLMSSMRTDPEAFGKQLGILVLTLHLVYEQFKLNMLTWNLMEPLASLLSSLAPKNYLDHYFRDLGPIRAVPIPEQMKIEPGVPFEHPPDIFSWVQKRMRRKPTETILMPFPELESCRLTQNICCFFDLLSGGTGDHATAVPHALIQRQSANKSLTSPVAAMLVMDGTFAHWMKVHGYEARNAPERTVLGMVWCGFQLEDLETLPFGVAVPLRETLHYCRNQPSGQWPADAYVLVGREDMAALVLAPPPPPVPNTNASNPLVEFKRVDSYQQQQQIQQRYHPNFSNYKTPKTNNDGSIIQDTPAPASSTAVTPVWRRLGTPANQVADDLLWHATTNTHAIESASKRHSSHKKHTPTSGTGSKHKAFRKSNAESMAKDVATKLAETGVWQHQASRLRLMSIADYSALCASLSVDANGGSNDLFMGVDPLLGNSIEGRIDGAVAPTSIGDSSEGHGAVAGHGVGTKSKKEADPSGFGLLHRITSLRFGRDRRLREVCRLLRSSSPVRLQVERGPEVSDHELVAQQQAKLMLLSRRTMALPVGRGMITMGTVRPLLTDPLEIPPLVLSGRIPTNNATVKLDLSGSDSGNEMTLWPCFHNGVAAGLRLSPPRHNSGNTSTLTRTWIAYNKPAVPNYEHAGFLLALGLNRHLTALTMADTYEYLAQGHDATTVAILLGLSAAKRGTMAPTISKMLCLHVPSLLPPAFAEMEVPPAVQTTALISVGLLYQTTANRLMTEFLLAEIGRKPTSDRMEDRESYSLSAGLALGLVTLGHGATPGGLSGLADLRLEDRLHRYLIGGLDPDAAKQSQGDPTKCSRIREGRYVNVNVTAPGATLALALTFLKSGNQMVAARLALPETHFLLDYVRPDLLLLRVLARGLVLWDSVQATDEWLENQLPEILRYKFDAPDELENESSSSNKQQSQHRRRSLSMSHFEDERLEQKSGQESRPASRRRRGVSDAEQLLSSQPARNNQSKGKTARMRRLKRRGTSMASTATRHSDGNPRIDEKSVRQARANIVAGACMAIGFRFVGTAYRPARDILLKYVRYFADIRRLESIEDHPDRTDTNTLETCLGAVAIALAMVMVGTGDLTTFRVLRSLRWKVENVSYGNHMNIGMAIGLVFLGGGRYSLSNDNAAIAALLIAFFPRLPIDTADNRYHNQVFRHLYALATEERCLDGYEVDSGLPCYVPLEITLKPNALHLYNNSVQKRQVLKQPIGTKQTTISMVTPCLLPPLDWISAVKVASSRYMDVNIDREGDLAALLTYRVLCVKRKVGHLSYGEDQKGVSSLLARPKRASENRVMLEDLPQLLAFSRNFCAHPPESASPEEKEFSEFCSTVLYECLADEKPDMINTFIELYYVLRRIPSAPTSPVIVQNINMLCTFYQYNPVLAKQELVPRAFLQSICDRINQLIDPAPLRSYLVPENDHHRNIPSTSFACYLHFKHIPPPYIIDEIVQHFAHENASLPVLALRIRRKHDVDAQPLIDIANALSRQ